MLFRLKTNGPTASRTLLKTRGSSFKPWIPLSTGASRRNAYSRVGLPHMYYSRFKKAVEKVEDLEKSAVYIPYKTNNSACKIHPGPPSLLSAIQDDLVHFVKHARHSGIQVSTHMIHQEACRLLPIFRDKSLVAQNAVVGRFVKRMGLSRCAATHTAQKYYKETQEESTHFIEFMRTKIAGKDPCDIINMDQTPIPYSFHLNKTLENKGTRSIHVRASTSDRERVTLAVTLDASGSMLPPMLIFKGTRAHKTYVLLQKNSRLTPLMDNTYVSQKQGWMRMQLTVRSILYSSRGKNTKALGVVPTLILDMYCIHMMENIVNCIQSLRIEVIHISARCTYLCQPVDVGISKSIKTGMSEKWEDWMLDGEGIVNGVPKEPSRKMVAEWLLDVHKNISRKIAMNAWMKKGCEWF